MHICRLFCFHKSLISWICLSLSPHLRSLHSLILWVQCLAVSSSLHHGAQTGGATRSLWRPVYSLFALAHGVPVCPLCPVAPSTEGAHSGRVPLPWAPALLQHQREVPSISYSPGPGRWSPLPEVYLGQGSGMLKAIALTEFLGPWCAAWILLVSRQWKCCHTLCFLPLFLIHEMLNFPREWEPLCKGTGKGLTDSTWCVLNFALLSLDHFPELSKDSKGSQSVSLTFRWTLKGIFLHQRQI